MAKVKRIEGCEIIVPSIEDLAIAKYISKDREYVLYMWKMHLVDATKMKELIELLPLEKIGNKICELVSEKVYADIDKYSPKW